VLTVAFGTFTFAENFVGNWSELGALFAWGFTADLSLDALVTAAGKLKKQ
jgi:hypothetical protein